MTIRDRFIAAQPRASLARLVGISPVYAHHIAMKNKPIGGTETLAQIAARLGLTDDEIGASVREMYPEHFTTSAKSEAA